MCTAAAMIIQILGRKMEQQIVLKVKLTDRVT